MHGFSRIQVFVLVGAASFAQGQEWDHSLYTTSPPVYPSPNITGTGGWENALVKAKAFTALLTLEEKTRLVTGTTGPCVGNIAPIPRLGFNGLCLHDGPLAIREAVYASVFPAGVTAAASWDRELIHQRGVLMAEEFKGKGSQILLGPVAGPLGRSPFGGRNWEGFSPDPYLTGVAMEQSIAGIQSAGVQACSKHYIGNEQETQRNPSSTSFFSASARGPTIEAVSANIDDRTMHELYLWPFANAVKAGTASMMCSYNRVNGSYGCENSKTLNGLLKDELGFQGYVMSDWSGTHSGVSAIEAGLDMNMPGGISFLSPTPSYWGPNITTAVGNSSVAISRLNDMVNRIMTPYYLLGQDKDFPTVDPSGVPLNFFAPASWVDDFFLNGTTNRDVRENHGEFIRELGSAGTVLLKNTENALPLKAPKNIAVYGNDAGDLTQGPYFLNQASDGLDSGKSEFGTLPVGGGSGTGRFSYVVSPLEAIKARARQDGALVQYVLDNNEITSFGLWSLAPTPPDVCLVFLKTFASEGMDRDHLEADWNGTAVVNTVAASCANTVVVTHSGGLNTLPFADHPNVTAILAAHYPGQETGNSIVDILYGDVNPSGHLPYTIAKSAEDYNSLITNSTALLNTTDPNAWQSDFEEKLLIDYRYFDSANISVQYEFGFGLSYTTFEITGDLSISASSSNITARSASTPVVPGGNPALWETLFVVSTTVKNTGTIAGAAVPQLYINLPSEAGAGTPPRQLRGFEKVKLAAGESKQVEFALMRRDLSYWDIVLQEWIIPSGEIGVEVGFSSRDVKLTGSLAI
ncbi:DNA mismatch repair protein Msh6 [Venturia nashicola]|nr:DNA mismatch repair protein Msh6 [Venturia nashicola]